MQWSRGCHWPVPSTLHPRACNVTLMLFEVGEENPISYVAVESLLLITDREAWPRFLLEFPLSTVMHSNSVSQVSGYLILSEKAKKWQWQHSLLSSLLGNKLGYMREPGTPTLRGERALAWGLVRAYAGSRWVSQTVCCSVGDCCNSSGWVN